MVFLYWLEGLRIPVLNEFMLFVTTLGEETAFLVVALILFWCVDKYLGYYVLSVGFLGTLANQFMKLWFRIPRPWALDENFTILEQAREAASGYSFPSGHTQNAVGTFGSIAYTAKKRWIRIGSCVVALLVPFSRMYIGVHTPLDVLVAAGMALFLILILKPIVMNNNGRLFPALLAIMTAAGISYLIFVECYAFPENIDKHNLSSGVKNGYTLIGAMFGLLFVYIIDRKWINFTTASVWWAQILKVLLGLILVLVVKSALKTPLNSIFGESIGRAVRYFLIVIVAGVLWPLTFKWFGKMRSKR